MGDLSFSVSEEIERLTVRAEAAEVAYEKAEEAGRAFRAQHDSLYSAVKEEVERLRKSASVCREGSASAQQTWATYERRGEAKGLEASADHLQAILDQAGEGS